MVLRSEAVARALEHLPYRERQVISARHGLGDDRARTLEELAATFRVTRERVRQIENGALAKLYETEALEGMAS